LENLSTMIGTRSTEGSSSNHRCGLDMPRTSLPAPTVRCPIWCRSIVRPVRADAETPRSCPRHRVDPRFVLAQAFERLAEAVDHPSRRVQCTGKSFRCGSPACAIRSRQPDLQVGDLENRGRGLGIGLVSTTAVVDPEVSSITPA
jgi:hypothetical protein